MNTKRIEYELDVVAGDTSWGTLDCRTESGEAFDLDSFLISHPGSWVEDVESPAGNKIKVVTPEKE